MSGESKKGFQLPNTVVVMFGMMLIAAVLTYILPGGQYGTMTDPSTGRTVYDPAAFEYIAGKHTTLLGLFSSIPSGIIDAISVIAIVLVYGASFGIINRTKVIECGLGASIEKLRKYSFLIIPVIMILFSLLGAFLGISESCMAFLPLCVVIAQSMGYDAIVGFAMCFVANNLGFTSGIMNYWTTGVAQGIAELPLYSGIGVRILIYIILMTLGIAFVLRYCSKLKKDPSASVLYDPNGTAAVNDDILKNVPEFTGRKKLALAALIAGMIGLVYCLTVLGWWDGSVIGGYLLIVAVIVALVDGQSANSIGEGFVEGAHNVLMGALAVGMARSILLILQNGCVVDTVLHGMYVALEHVPSVVAAVCMYIFQFFFNFLVPSGSGQAGVTMPLMSPLADMVGITRQTAVIAFQLGDGFSNLVWPTAAMAALSIAKIDYGKWMKWYLPFTLLIIVVSSVIVAVCAAVGLGPF